MVQTGCYFNYLKRMYPLGCPPSQFFVAHEGLGFGTSALAKTCKNPDGDYYREGGQLNVHSGNLT